MQCIRFGVVICLVTGFAPGWAAAQPGATAGPGAATGGPLRLKAHPRLWVSRDTALNLKDKLNTPYLQTQARRILADADWLVEAKPIAEREASTYQQGTRTIASHLQCLTAAWVLTHETKYRQAAMRHLANLKTWNLISCESRNHSPPDRNEFFCLSYGEHCADIALMYDFFRPDITEEEQKIFFDVLDRFYLKEALEAAARPPWWAFKEWSNWNGVCAGGIGMLALAFYDDRPECRKLIPFVEQSLGEYFKSYIKSGGGNHEGTGYWNYGMHYSMRYLLSWENATGRKHPAFQIKELIQSLHFPLDFTGITFGDNDGWHPTGFFFIVAERTGQREAALRAAAYLPERVQLPQKDRKRFSRAATGDVLYGADCIPTTEEMQRLRKAHALNKEPVARVYEGLDWAALADDSAFPAMRLSARGGSSQVTGHGMLDLLSFKCMLNGVQMIGDQTDGGYLAPTFTGRGTELHGRSAASKSTLFVDGLGCRENVHCRVTEVVKGEGILGIRIDGTGVCLSWARVFTGRLFLLMESRYWLVVDRVHDPGRGSHWIESRFHTYADVETGDEWAALNREDENLAMTFAALDGGVIQQARGLPSLPRKQTNVIRWMSARGSHDLLHVTALNPGTERISLALGRTEDGGFAIKVADDHGYRRTIKVTDKLQLADQVD